MAQKSMGTRLACQVNNETVSIGRLRSISEIRADSEAVDVTTLDAPGGFRMYAQGVKNMGEVTLEGFHDTQEASQAILRSLFESGEIVLFTVTFPDETAVSFSAFVKAHAMGAAEVDGAVGFTAVLRISGGVTLQ
ncbi:MAG: hypothetical protein E7329_08180 [Clostridiales bacterium]|nr:hypothetical protein [Clostridiales bacterium]